MYKSSLLLLLCCVLIMACAQINETAQSSPSSDAAVSQQDPLTERKDKLVKTDEEWKSQLSDQEYYVLREKGTERPFTGTYWDNKASGTYLCKGCGLSLFDSATKFKSGTGWPSFYQAVDSQSIHEVEDLTHGMRRVEVVCGRCDGHLGHVFPDGPKPTGLRYCINSVSLEFKANP